MTQFDLSSPYWTETRPDALTGPRKAYDEVPVFHSVPEALAASYEDRQRAEWNMPYEVDYGAGRISRLERWMRRPPLFFAIRVWEIMEYGWSGGEFPLSLVEAYSARNGDVWPLLEEAGFRRGADNDRSPPDDV